MVAHGADSSRYKISYLKTIRGLGLDLYKSLAPKQRAVLNPEPVSVITDVTPMVQLSSLTEDNKTLGFVFVSVGFIDLVNNVAHAKAIDTVEKGYFEKYILSLSHESGDKELRDLPNIDNPKYWTDAVMQEQLSNLRQMVGTVVAIKLAHVYLGNYQKYASSLDPASSTPKPIEDLVTPEEWDTAMKAGVRNGLETGLGIEGIKALFETIDKMPTRPAWTEFFLPVGAKAKGIAKEMEKIEKKVFAGQ